MKTLFQRHLFFVFCIVFITSFSVDAQDDSRLETIQNRVETAAGSMLFKLNGNTQKMKELGIKEDIFEDLSIYPNPSSSSFNVEFQPLKKGVITIKIYNSQGKIIVEKTFNNTANHKFLNKINLNDVVSGVYMMEIKNGSYKTVKRLVKK